MRADRTSVFFSAVDVVGLAICLLITPLVRAQSFEVASIRPSTVWQAGGQCSSSRSQIEHGPDSLTMVNVDLGEIVQWAYGLQPYQLSGQNMLRDRRYDVRAKSAGPVAVAQLRSMLQGLLANRFKVTVHRES